MMDFARSSDPAVQHQLDRLAALSPGGDILGLERITRLLEKLGDPHRSLPPVFHVAGTNGKGSTCAFLRAALEAAGHRVHVYTSPHLVRFNERIRLSGTLIADDALAALLSEVLDVASDTFETGTAPSFFEVTTASAFLAFARVPADACVIEVGLGGRLDATNVIEAPVATGIAQLDIDHQAFLGNSITDIAYEKAGIAKRGVPLVTGRYPKWVNKVIAAAASEKETPWLPRGGAWDFDVVKAEIRYRDRAGSFSLPVPKLQGGHQALNAGLAVGMLRHQERFAVPTAALEAMCREAKWPGRLQPLAVGPLTSLLPAGSSVWLDGGHNPAAARAIVKFIGDALLPEIPLYVVCGLLANKDANGVLRAFWGSNARFCFVPVEEHACHSPGNLTTMAHELRLDAASYPSVEAAFDHIGKHDRSSNVLIMGSLYLAGEVLADNRQPPT